MKEPKRILFVSQQIYPYLDEETPIRMRNRQLPEYFQAKGFDLVGILRGMQQVKSIAIIAFIAYIVLNIPVGYLVAFKFNMGATGLIVGYIVGLTTAAILYGVQVARHLRYLRKIS